MMIHRLSLLTLAAALTAVPEAGIRVKRLVALEYPWFARLAGAQGDVNALVVISQQGTTKDVRVTSGPEPLAREVKKTLLRWTFEGCTSYSGCEVTVRFSFRLDGVCDASQRCQTDFEADLPDKVTVKSKHAHAIVD